MKFIVENEEDVKRLANMWIDKQVTMDEYREATSEWYDDTRLKQESEWKSWIDTESIRGPKKSWREKLGRLF